MPSPFEDILRQGAVSQATHSGAEWRMRFFLPQCYNGPEFGTACGKDASCVYLRSLFFL